MFLTPEQIEQLTGLTQPAAQYRYLVEQGYSPDKDRQGRPILLADAVYKRQGVQSTMKRKTQPNFGALTDGKAA